MTMRKIHVRDSHKATISCPACGLIKHVSVEKFRQARHTVTIQCRCQEIFHVQFDFRRHFRKQTSLPGVYAITGVGGGIIHIRNISRGGLGFTVSGLHQFLKDQEIELEFHLNDKKKTALKKQAVVRSVQQNYIGCEFKDAAELEKALGFYLQG